MVIKLNAKMFFILLILIAVTVLTIIAIFNFSKTPSDMFLGGFVRSSAHNGGLSSADGSKPALYYQDGDYSQRYQRPSSLTPLHNPYTLQSFMKNIPEMKTPQDAVYAYYGILKEASNMEGFSGGCGTIGDADIPYPYAYELLSSDAKKNMSLQQFTDSFRGTGHISFLKLHELPAPENALSNTKYYMTEIEIITGKKGNVHEEISYFAYYYGIVSVNKESSGWKIRKIEYYPENFLCAPYHSWFYDSKSLVEIVYIDNLKKVSKITGSTEENGLIYIYADGIDGEKYRFDFVRLTNGYDILINENIMKNGQWAGTSLLTDDWKSFRLSP